MRAEYKTILVRFRKDDPGHMAAWDYIHDRCSRKTAVADVIAEMVKGNDRSDNVAPASEKQIADLLLDVLHLCQVMDAKIDRDALSPASEDISGNDIRQEKDQSEVEAGIIDFALDMGD